MPDIGWSVHNSPDQSSSKTTVKGLNVTGALIFCTLLVKHVIKTIQIEGHKSVISVIKITGIATFDINMHFCWGLMRDSVIMHRLKQTRKM